jgi:thiamine-phosphate pyrophosphorylase
MPADVRVGAVRIYLITDSTPRLAPLEDFLERAIAGGVGMVQLREKRLPDADLLDVARRCARACARLRIPFIVNDRVDVCLSAKADGVHLGQSDLPVESARSILGRSGIIGLSTHSREQIDAARRLAVDYIGVGPIYETPTKPGRPAVGIELIEYAAANAGLPFFAIGGIDPDTVVSVVQAGASGVSVLRSIAQAEDPQGAAAALVQAIEKTRAAAS